MKFDVCIIRTNMENKNPNQFYEDICNLGRVLPNLAPSVIYRDLNDLKDNPNRVELILKKYFSSYESEVHNCMSDDIKKIKRVLPNYPFIHINNDLSAVEDKDNRVQLVLKEYFENQLQNTKRSLEEVDTSESNAGKKLKTDNVVVNQQTDVLLEKNNEIQTSASETESYTIASDDLKLDQFENSEEKGEDKTVENFSHLDASIRYDENQSKEAIVETNQDTSDQVHNLHSLNAEHTNILPDLTSFLSQGSLDIFNCQNSNNNSVPICTEIKKSDSSQPIEIKKDLLQEGLFSNTDNTSIQSVLSSLFPQHSLETFKAVSQNFGFDLNDPPNETAVAGMVQLLLNYDIYKETFQSDKTYDNQISFSTFTSNQNSEENISKEPGTKEDNTFSSTQNKYLLGSNSSSQDGSTESYNLINDEMQTFLHKFNTPQQECETKEKSIAVPLSKTDGCEDSNKTSCTNNYNGFLTELISRLDSEQPKENDIATNSTVLKPATFQPNTASSYNTDATLRFKSSTYRSKTHRMTSKAGNIPGHSVVMKPATFLPKSNKLLIAGSDVRSSTNAIRSESFHPKINTPTETSNRISTSSVIKPATFQPKMNAVPSNIGFTCLADPIPSTSGLQNGNPIDLTSKSSIRVRTDLYDMYFNGPILESNNDPCNENNNDDVIFVSAGQIPENKPTSSILHNDDVGGNVEIKAEENSSSSSSDLEQPTTSATNNDQLNQPTELQTTHPFYFKLLEIFPDICPQYLKKFCSEATVEASMDDLVSILLSADYRKRDRPESPESNLEFEEQHKLLQDLFPDADPSYLQHHCERLIDQPQNFKLFVSSLIENKNYPTKTEYLKKLKLSAQEKQYTTEFSVEKFLEVIPNPEEYFSDPKRQVVSQKNFDDIEYAITFLKNKFSTCSVRDITTIFKKTMYSVIRSTNLLETFKPMKTKRRPYPVTSCKNIPLLQEIAYVKHKQEILAYIQKKEMEKFVARQQAKSAGLLKCCECCYDDEIMPEDIETCESKNHIFCKECIKRGCEVIIGDGKLEFPCLANCDSFFTLQVLQNVLTPKVFSKMALRKQMEEVKSAGIEDLESCPFCDFATIPAPGDKIFRCLNDDCMKESCRLCKEPSHIPLRCDEVEKDQQVKMRTYIEDKMTEALLRKCYKCGLKFIKESGCNKMTCSCGAMMCYVCNKPVNDYKHFNGQGGDQFHLCPLYSDTHKLHMDAVKQSAQSAMKELGVDNTNQLKIDPTVDLERHYRRLAEQNPAIPNIPMFPNNLVPR